MQPTEMPVSPAEKEQQEREIKQRAELLRELNIDAKTDAEKAEAKLNRVQLFYFLTKTMDALLRKEILVSRPSETRFWCQTGFFVRNNVVFAKYGEALMQPIGWDTGTEFWMTSASKFLWKHEFALVPAEAGKVDSPFTITVNETEKEDTEGLNSAEREALTNIAKDVVSVLDLKPTADWKREDYFKPEKPKAKWGPGELIEKVRTFLTENEAKISERAVALAEAGVAEGKYDEGYAAATAEAKANGLTLPELKLWAQGYEASRLAEEESSAFAQALAAETTEYTETELDALAWRAEHRDRAVETLKFWAVKSRVFDDRLRKLFNENPELNENFDNADVLGLLASVVTWANTSLTDDRISRTIRSTTMKAQISVDEITKAEGEMALLLVPMVVDARKALGRNVDEISDNDPRLLRAMGVVSQARVALPAVEARIQELKEILIDQALDEIQKVLDRVMSKAGVGIAVSIGNLNCVAKVQISTEPAKA